MKTTAAVMDETCTVLAGRIAELLAPGEASAVPPPAALAAPRVLASIVSRILATHRLSGFAGPVTLRFNSPDLAVRHPAEVERILDGLVANACKHGPAGEPIEICAFTHGGTVEILVADRGPGVRAELLPFLFRPDMQRAQAPHLDGSRRSGLYLAGEQASALDGRLSYVAGGQATTFRLLVPA